MTSRSAPDANPSIFLVEDDVRLSELVSRYLESNGFRVTTLARGDQVVEQVQREAPELVILDLGLPGQDGFSICRQLRPHYANPILILTARNKRHRSRIGPGVGRGRLCHQASGAEGAPGQGQRALAAQPSGAPP